jgi:predicted DNA-binding protein
MPKSKVMTFRLSEPVSDMLRQVAKQNGVTMSAYIEESIKRQIGSMVDDLDTTNAAPLTIKFQGGSMTFDKAVKIANKGILILDPKLAK